MANPKTFQRAENVLELIRRNVLLLNIYTEAISVAIKSLKLLAMDFKKKSLDVS